MFEINPDDRFTTTERILYNIWKTLEKVELPFSESVETMNRKELLSYAKEIGLQGKFVTLKTEELREEIRKVI